MIVLRMTTTAVFCCSIIAASAFQQPTFFRCFSRRPVVAVDFSCLRQNQNHDSDDCMNSVDSNLRRYILRSATSAVTFSWLISPTFAYPTNNIETEQVPMKHFDDSLFQIDVPARFFAIRRSAKGDLPDAKTGKGRRGGTIFTAGDLSKAEVIAVERFPVRALLEEEGYQASGDLSTFPSIGDAAVIATLIIRHREKDKPGTQNTAMLNKDSIILSTDGATLYFSLRQQINVEKPDLLMDTIGVSELFRTTFAKATLGSNDGQLMAVFASALDQDIAGPDGIALKKSVESFIATDQSATLTN